MFLYYARVVALGLLTLTISCPLYSMKSFFRERTKEDLARLKQPDKAPDQEANVKQLEGYLRVLRKMPATIQKENFIEKAPTTIRKIAAQLTAEEVELLADRLGTETEEIERLRDVLQQTTPSLSSTKDRLLIVAADLTTKAPSILLVNRNGYNWSALEASKKDLDLIKTQYSNLDLNQAKKEKLAEGATLFIVPVNYVPANSFKVADAEFIWIPVDEFTTTMTRVSKPLSSKGLTGQPELASVNYQLQQSIKELAPTLKQAASQPLTSTTSTQISSTKPQQGSEKELGSITISLKQEKASEPSLLSSLQKKRSTLLEEPVSTASTLISGESLKSGKSFSSGSSQPSGMFPISSSMQGQSSSQGSMQQSSGERRRVSPSGLFYLDDPQGESIAEERMKRPSGAITRSPEGITVDLDPSKREPTMAEREGSKMFFAS